MSTRHARWVALVLLLAVTACGEATAPASEQPGQVDINEGNLRLLVGNQRSLSAVVRSFTGATLTEAPEWSSNDAGVATVDASGLVRAAGPGQAQIFATAGTASDFVVVTVPTPAGTVGSAGAVIVADGGNVRLVVPAGAVPAGTVISIAPALADSLPEGSIALPGAAYEFGPAGLTFSPPATLTIRYDRGRTSPLESPRLRVQQLSGGAWSAVPGGTGDTASAEVTAPISSFSIYGVAPIPNLPPVATIASPEDGTEVFAGTEVVLTGSAEDPEDGTLTGSSLAWSSSLDGALGTGDSIATTELSVGGHTISLVATDEGGGRDTARVALTVLDGPPVVQILEPSADTTVLTGHQVVFRGSATDAVDGTIPGDSLTWTSSLDGALGTGDSIATSGLSEGEHMVTLSATDSQGNTGVDSVTVGVGTNQAPVVTITSPADGASVGDRSGTTFSGTADDAEDGALTGSALVWTSSLDGTLGTGTSFGRGALTVGTHTITLTATDSEGDTGTDQVTITVFDQPDPPPTPVLVYVGEAGGTLTLSVSNSASYDPALFVLDPSLPPCGADPNGSRTWVEVFDGSGTKLHTFCDFDDPADMASMSFTPASPPAQLYIELWDRDTGLRARSNTVTPVPTTPTSIHGVVVNDRDADLNTLDPGEALSGVTVSLIQDVDADGVIDAGETTYATTSTDGSGAYSFTGLWPGNYIVRAVGPAGVTVLRGLASDGTVTDQTGTLLTTTTPGAGATLNQSGTVQVGNTEPPAQGDELPRWGYALGTAAFDGGLEPSGPGPNAMNGALTTAPAHFVFLYSNGSLSGSVKTAGVGVPGARVTVTRCQTAPSAPSPPAAGACSSKHGTPSPHIVNVDTDADGNYAVSGLLEGVYQIEVAPQTAGYGSVDVPAGGTYLAVLKGDGDSAEVPDFSIS